MKRAYPWLVGALTATLLLTALPLANGLRYADTGDALMMKTFAGFAGAPAHFHAELHTALSWLMYVLHAALPTVAWLSVVQLFALWLSCAVTVRGATLIAENNRLPAWAGTAMGALFCLALGLYAYCRVDHAATAALLGASAVVQLMSVDYRRATDKEVLHGVLPCAPLLLLAYCLSARAGVVALALWILGGVYVRSSDYSHREIARRGTSAHKGLRGLIVGMMVGVFCLAGFYGVRALELGAMGDYTEWQSARAELMGNSSFPDAVTDDMLQTAGWTRDQFSAMTGGFQYGSELTADSMRKLAAQLPQDERGIFSFVTRAADGLSALWDGNGAGRAQLLICMALAVLALCACLLSRRRALLCALPLVALLLGFVALGCRPSGDPPDGAETLVALAPVSALLLCVTLRTRATAMAVRWRALICASLCLISCGLCLAGAMRGQMAVASMPPQDAEFEAALYEYALDKPDKLIFYSPELATDTRMFPDLTHVPQNLVLPDESALHGDALATQLKRFGLDAGRFNARALLGENVLFAGTDKGPWRRLLPYLHETMTGTYNWASYEERGGLCLYRLCER